jgi:hypothetical protein
MANAIYLKAKEQFLQGGINLASSTVRVALVDTATYTYSSAHEFYSSVSGVVGAPQIITPKLFANGTFACTATLTFPLVSGASVEALVIYVDTGTPATSRLIAYLDTGVTGLPVTPNGNDITLVFAPSTGAIFTL